METGVSSRFNLKTLIVSICCLIGAVGGAYLLYQDFDASGKAGHGPPLAKVERKESKVRRKAASSYIWANVKTSEDLYRKDSIQTSTSSAVAIRLKGGALLELGENSLVVLDDIQNLSLNFLRGSVVVRSESGDQKISVGADGKTKVEALKIRLEKPESQAYLFTVDRKTKSVAFQWQVMGELNEQTTLQISKDKNFLPSSIISVAADQKTQSLLDPGIYFWRVSGATEPLTETRQFRVVSVLPLNPTWPNASQKLPSFGEDTTVPFRWSITQATAGVDENFYSKGTHWIEVSKDPQFKTVSTKQEITFAALNASIAKIPSGSYFYRIASAYGEHILSSRIERFTVEASKKLALELQSPQDQSAFEAAQALRFTWNCDASNLDYQLDIETSSGKPVSSQKTKALTYTWKNPASAGTYRWKITALWQNQKISETTWRNFALFNGKPLATLAPTQNQAIHYWSEPTAFKFSWKEDDTAPNDAAYLVQVSQDANFKEKTISAKTTDTALSSTELKIPQGELYWRVTLLDNSGMALKSSTPVAFNYGMHPPLRAPASATPAEGGSIDLMQTDGTPKATWETVKEAEGYEITLYSGKKVVFKTTTEKPEVELKGVKEGTYAYSIRAIDKIKRRGEPLEIKQFKMSYGQPLSAPQVISPEVQ